jgi:uncharacterized SAM-binding protein YcdF (DUF218 family)
MSDQAGKKRLRRLKMGCSGIMMILLTIPMTIFVATAWRISGFDSSTDRVKADAAIVLGAALEQGKPCPVFAARILHAKKLLDAGRINRIILTGGTGPDQKISEAQAAALMLRQLGVPPGALLLEETSRNTEENLRRAWALAKPGGIKTVFVVSDRLHMKRSMLIAADLKIPAFPAPTPNSMYRSKSSRVSFLASESWKYLKYLTNRSSPLPDEEPKDK